VTSWLTVALIVGGTLVTLLAAVGMLRFPDIFTRMHATSKPASLGLILFAIAAAIQIGGVAGTVKVVLVILFVFLKAPVSSQALSRAAEVVKEPVFEGTELPDQPVDGTRTSVLARVPDIEGEKPVTREPIVS